MAMAEAVTVCYFLHISTDSADDLTVYNSRLLRFEKRVGLQSKHCIALLAFPNQWHVGSKDDCSCAFRHLDTSDTPWFGEPEDWCPEEPDEIMATGELYRVLAQLLAAGYAVDCLDVWVGTEPNAIQMLDVSLGDVPEASFQLFHNHRFVLRKDSI